MQSRQVGGFVPFVIFDGVGRFTPLLLAYRVTVAAFDFIKTMKQGERRLSFEY